MNIRITLLAAMMVSVALAGCTNGGDGPDDDDLSEGKGGINGLLVDDRFRPIHLTDNPQSEFDADGVILLSPTGDLLQTTVNGEFTVTDLTPGTYTLRVQAPGYEAAPMTIEVEAGLFAEATIEARRTTNEGGTVLTQEYAIFIDCWYATPIVLHTEVNCFADLSRDSKRGGMRADYSHIDNVTYMVAEFLISEPGNYRTLIGFGAGEAVEEEYARVVIEEGDYSRMLLSTDAEAVRSDSENETGLYGGHFDNTRDWIAVVFPLGEKLVEGDDYPSQEVPDPTDPDGEETIRVGADDEFAGAGVATRAQVITTIFIGDPELGPDDTLQDYCVICGDADQ